MKKFLIFLLGCIICTFISHVVNFVMPPGLKWVFPICLGGFWGCIWSHEYINKDL